MSVRVDYTEVQAIIGDTSLDSAQIEAFIEAASQWVDDNLVDGCAAISELMLAQIEKFLAAHLCTSADPLLESSKRGDIAETYKRGKDDVTEYLTAAAAMDPCGIVAQYWMGKTRLQFKAGTTYTAEAC